MTSCKYSKNEYFGQFNSFILRFFDLVIYHLLLYLCLIYSCFIGFDELWTHNKPTKLIEIYNRLKVTASMMTIKVTISSSCTNTDINPVYLSDILGYLNVFPYIYDLCCPNKFSINHSILVL